MPDTSKTTEAPINKHLRRLSEKKLMSSTL